jgi:uncharacterized protein (DUF4213/DUF364 family)
MSPQTSTRILDWSGSVAGKPAAEVAAWVRSWDMHRASVGMAAINAVLNPDSGSLLQQSTLASGPVANLSVFEWFLPFIRGKKIVVVGRYPDLERYQKQLDMTVLERQPGVGDLPDTACEYLLPQAEWVFLTGSSIANKTFPRLAELSSNANVVLMGPSVPWLPELADFGIDFLAGVSINEPAVLRRVIAEGGGKRIFEGYVNYHIIDLGQRKMDLIKSSIEDVVARREFLKQEMENWYSENRKAGFPWRDELEKVDQELSELDLRFKRIWDLRHDEKTRIH